MKKSVSQHFVRSMRYTLFCLFLMVGLASCMNLNSSKSPAGTGTVSFTISNGIISQLEKTMGYSRTADASRSAAAPEISIDIMLKDTSDSDIIDPFNVSGTLQQLNGRTITIRNIPLNTPFTVFMSIKVDGKEVMNGTSETITLMTSETTAVTISLQFSDSLSSAEKEKAGLWGTWFYDYGYNQELWADDQVTFYIDGSFETHHVGPDYSEWDKGTYSIEYNNLHEMILLFHVTQYSTDEWSTWNDVDVTSHYSIDYDSDELFMNRFQRDHEEENDRCPVEYYNPAIYNHWYRVKDGTQEQLENATWNAVKSNDYWNEHTCTWTFNSNGTMVNTYDSSPSDAIWEIIQEDGRTLLYVKVTWNPDYQEWWYDYTSLGPDLIHVKAVKHTTNGIEDENDADIYFYRDVPLVKYTYHWKVSDDTTYTFYDYWPAGETYTLLDSSKINYIRNVPYSYLEQQILGIYTNEAMTGDPVKKISAAANTDDQEFWVQWGLKAHHNGTETEFCHSTSIPASDVFPTLTFSEDDTIAIHFEADLSNDINGWTQIKIWPEEWGEPIAFGEGEVHTTGRHLSETYRVNTTEASGDNMTFEYVYNKESGPVVFSNCTFEILDSVTLTILAYGDEDPTFMRICDEFQAENPEIIINYEMFGDEEYHQKVGERIASNNIPDIAYMGADARWGDTWRNAGQQVDNTPYMPANIDQSFIPDFFGTGEKPYIPLGGSNFCSVVGVNKKLLEEIGGTIPTTYEEFKELAQLCAANGISCLSTHGADDWVWGSCVMSGIIPRTTGKPTWIEDAINGKVKFTDDDFTAALDVLAQWVDDGILTPEAVDTDDETGKSNFASGKYLMYIDGQWGFGESSYGDFAKDIKLITIPPVPGETACPGSMAGAWQAGYGITKKGASDSKVLEAAKKWMAYFYSYGETLQRLYDGAISCPIIKDFTLPEEMDPIIAEKAKLNVYQPCYVIDTYLTGNANDTLNAGMKAIVQGKKTAAEVAYEVQAAFDAQ